jgi:electron transfer flavoprotein beta subunit
MKIAVCVKQVPDTESRVEVGPDEVDIDRSAVTFLVNPYDEFAVEEAIRIRERSGGEVVAVSLCPHRGQRVEDALRSCLAMGADRAVLLRDEDFEGGDSLATATALAAALRREAFELALFGKQAVDSDGGAVGVQVAELLGWPHVGVVERLELDSPAGRAVADRQIEGGIERVATPLPAVITCQKGLNEPRYPNLPGILKAKKKPLEIWNRQDLGLEPEKVGARGSKLRRLRLEALPRRPQCRILTGDGPAVVRELVRLLAEEAGVI